MIKTITTKPIKYVLECEKEEDNPTVFWIKPMTYGEYQEDIRLVKLKNTDGTLDVVNAEEVEEKFFKKYIVKIENIEHNGENLETVEDADKIFNIIQNLPISIGNELKTAVENTSELSEQDSKN